MNYRPIDYFINELNLIKDCHIKDFVIEILNNCHQDNFIRGSSSTGKYHPKFSQGTGGLVRHTKALVKMLTVFEAARPDIKVWNEIYAAAILHDMCKYDGGKYTVKNHAEIMARMISDSKSMLIAASQKFIISELVKYHMGRFDVINFSSYDNGGVEEIIDNMNEAQWILHYADMIVSRKWYGTKDVYVEGE